ncbi:MAG: TRAP transporter substrate-binding protein DctP [Verrucomicrobiota bacterium]
MLLRKRYGRFGWILALGALIALPAGAAAPAIKLKLGTLAPAGTSYHKSLQAMGEKWRKLSDGAVQLMIFPGGTQGGEADMVGLMQTGNLDAGLHCRWPSCRDQVHPRSPCRSCRVVRRPGESDQWGK